MNQELVIETVKLSRSFRDKDAVKSLDLQVPKGSIFALLGTNGAGKTTTIKMLMNILRPSAGHSAVMGVDSYRLGPKEFNQIGYVSENQEMPEWMRVQDFLAYCKPFYSRWDNNFCGRLLKQFALPSDTKIKHLSRGMKGKLALLSSLAYHPNLLVLDEPFSGLDPIVRQEFVEGITEIFEQEDWSIFISSHDIEEVERLADYVGLLIDGELKLVESVSSLQERFRRIEGNFAQPEVKLVPLPDRWIQLQQVDHAFRFIETGYQSMETEREVYRLFPDVTGLSVTPMSLREIFIALGRRYQLLN